MEFAIKKDILIVIDEKNKMMIYTLENPLFNHDIINLNINVTVLYIPNFYVAGFENNLGFLGTENGDLFIIELTEFKFLQFNFNFKSIKKYLSDNKIKLKTFIQSDTLFTIRLDQTDYSKLFLIYPHFGLFILNLQVNLI
jgi:hypothetical protein